MEPTTIKKFKWIPGWEDDKEEAWLRQMAQQGWHLRAPGVLGFYTFDRGEPRDDVYRLDYCSQPKSDLEGYLQLFKDAGWEHLGEAFGWQYFRKQAVAGAAPEIYTDPESKVQKYRRLLGLLGGTAPAFTILIILIERQRHLLLDALLVLFALFLIMYAVLAIKILGRIRQLKSL